MGTYLPDTKKTCRRFELVPSIIGRLQSKHGQKNMFLFSTWTLALFGIRTCYMNPDILTILCCISLSFCYLLPFNGFCKTQSNNNQWTNQLMKRLFTVCGSCRLAQGQDKALAQGRHRPATTTNHKNIQGILAQPKSTLGLVATIRGCNRNLQKLHRAYVMHNMPTDYPTYSTI